MSKLHKKCFLASAGLHGLLFVVLLIGPAFLMSKTTEKNRMPTLDFIPSKLIDDTLGRASAPKQKPIPTPPQKQQVKKVEPPKPKPPTKEPPSPKRTEPKDTGWKAIPVDIKDAIRKPTQRKPPPSRSRSNQEAKEIAQVIRKSVAATPSIKISTPSGGGPAYANYAQAIKSIYEHHWHPPDETSRDDAVVRVQIVIGKDGTVRSARIIGRCGDASVDASVDATLRRVTKVPPFPTGAKESTRTYTIGFNLKAKRGHG